MTDDLPSDATIRFMDAEQLRRAETDLVAEIARVANKIKEATTAAAAAAAAAATAGVGAASAVDNAVDIPSLQRANQTNETTLARVRAKLSRLDALGGTAERPPDPGGGLSSGTSAAPSSTPQAASGDAAERPSESVAFKKDVTPGVTSDRTVQQEETLSQQIAERVAKVKAAEERRLGARFGRLWHNGVDAVLDWLAERWERFTYWCCVQRNVMFPPDEASARGGMPPRKPAQTSDDGKSEGDTSSDSDG